MHLGELRTAFGLEHGFLLVQFHHSQELPYTYKLERTVSSDGQAQDHLYETAFPSEMWEHLETGVLSRGTRCVFEVHLAACDRADYKTYLRNHSNGFGRPLTMGLDVYSVLSTVVGLRKLLSEVAPEYTLRGSNCWWYACTASHLLEIAFRDFVGRCRRR
jgi:hypothetical protein